MKKSRIEGVERKGKVGVEEVRNKEMKKSRRGGAERMRRKKGRKEETGEGEI